MKSKSPEEILSTFTEDIEIAGKRLSSLHTKQYNSWALLTNQQFTMGKKKGDYEDVTTNKATVLGNKVIGKLANGVPSFSFKLQTEVETERQQLAKTERFVYAAMGKADARLKTPIGSGSVHGGASFYAPIFGGIIPRVILWEDKDGEIVFDVAFFNPYYTYWGMGADGISWIAQKRWASTDEIEELYPDATIKEDTAKEGYVEVYDYLNEKYEGVIIGEEWADKPYEHKIGHVPALVLPAGGRPLVQMGDNDEQSHSWYSVFDNDRNLYPVDNKLATLRMTAVTLQVNRPFILQHDSRIGGGAWTPDSNPLLPGGMVHVDIGKGEALIPSIPANLTRDMEVLEKRIDSDILMGGMSPVSFGQSESGQPAAAIAMLLDADADVLKPFKKCVEQAEQWIAMEIIRQVKNGNFTKREIDTDGFDNRNERFSLKVKPDELEDKKEIVCEIQMTSSMGNLQNVGMAKQLTEGDDPLIDKQTVRDTLLQVFAPDTDAVNERLLKEKLLKAFPDIEVLLMLSAVLKDKGQKKEDIIQILLNKYDEILNKSQPQPTPENTGMQPLPGQGQVNPQGMVASMQQPPLTGAPLDIPPGVRNAMRLNKMGLTYAGR